MNGDERQGNGERATSEKSTWTMQGAFLLSPPVMSSAQVLEPDAGFQGEEGLAFSSTFHMHSNTCAGGCQAHRFVLLVCIFQAGAETEPGQRHAQISVADLFFVSCMRRPRKLITNDTAGF